MSNTIMCPACGATDVIESISTEFKQLTLGPDFEVKFSNYHCNVCGEEGDFSLANDSVVASATKEAQKVFVKNTLNEFDSKIPLVRIERALELPFRTLNRWKSGDFSASSLALLRILKTYPWIIDVADNRFNKRSASVSLIQAAANCISDQVKTSNLAMDVFLENQPNAVTVRANISKSVGHVPQIYAKQKLIVGG